MPEHLIVCGGVSTAARGKRLAVRLNDPGRTFRLELDHIARPISAEIPPRVIDLLEIAAYVFAADQSIGRGGPTRRDWGRDWRRSMHFCIPVRDLAFWVTLRQGPRLRDFGCA